MPIENEVLDRVKKLRRAMLLQQAGIIAMLAVGIGALLVLVIIPFSLGSTRFSPLVKDSGMSGLIWTGIIIAVVLGLAGIGLYIAGRNRDLAYYARFTRRSQDYDLSSLAPFMNALDGVAGRADLEAPYVAVLDRSVPNALAFSGKEGLVIGVTSGALGAGLDYEQAEAIMAHELASAVTGDYLRRPGSARFEGAALGMLWLLAVIGIVAVPVTRRGNSSLLTFVIALAIIGYLVLASLWLRQLRKALEHDCLLADSIAVKLTGDPEAMRGAIETMDSLVNKRRRSPFPESELGLKYLFMPPRRWSEDAMAFLKRRSDELNYSLSEGAARRRAQALQQEMDDLAAWSEQLLADRLENMEAIEEGVWKAFKR